MGCCVAPSLLPPSPHMGNQYINPGPPSYPTPIVHHDPHTTQPLPISTLYLSIYLSQPHIYPYFLSIPPYLYLYLSHLRPLQPTLYRSYHSSTHYITNLIRIHLDNIYVTTKQQRSFTVTLSQYTYVI